MAYAALPHCPLLPRTFLPPCCGCQAPSSASARPPPAAAALPRRLQVVALLDGRRVLHLAAGGNYTMAVCEHDARAAAARLSRESDDFASSGASLAITAAGLVRARHCLCRRGLVSHEANETQRRPLAACASVPPAIGAAWPV